VLALSIAILLAFLVEIVAFKGLGLFFRGDSNSNVLPAPLMQAWRFFGFLIHIPALSITNDPSSPLVFAVGYAELVIVIFLVIAAFRAASAIKSN
jgi:hypothetical protein